MVEHPSIDDLRAYLAGTLSPEQSGAIEAHVETCESCTSALDAMMDCQHYSDKRVVHTLHNGNDDITAGEAIQGDTGTEQAPRRIGPYAIERVLGRGGFGVVYLGRDEQLQRPVAIKVPHKDCVARSEDVEQYLREARTVARLKHPHIVSVPRPARELLHQSCCGGSAGGNADEAGEAPLVANNDAVLSGADRRCGPGGTGRDGGGVLQLGASTN